MKQLLVILLLITSGNLFSQSNPESLINTFFETYEKDAGKAVKDLYATNKWTERIKDDIDKIIGTVNGFTENYMGKYYGYEVITSKKFSESLVLYSYLIKYERQPLRFIFKFYKPNNKWVLYSYAIDDDLDIEIQEAAKLYYLNLDKE
ncbi:hypothetical protein [Mangrovimonas spongiae]|uniref:DUF3887 domain-containing protein n=1 Tax=Mangrovimonas spongiae TaxID=2494697 RepID=A0A3R9ME19_9FLAO|nr:hypothetical protein [Mangrovimonas spongiae]RSK39856.1 hypothetical protein EJA19_08215 [Mangrovimonas spongiae]